MGKKAAQEKYIMGEKCFHKFGFRPNTLAVFRQRGMLTPAKKGKGYLVCELQKLRQQTDEKLKDYVFLAEIRRQWGLSKEDLLAITRYNQFPETTHIIGLRGSLIKKSEWLSWEAKHKEVLITKQKLRQQIENPDPNLLDLNQVVEMTGITKEWIWRKKLQNKFPKPVVRAEGVKGMLFRKSDVEEWILSTKSKPDKLETNQMFSAAELKDIVLASKLLDVEPNLFIKEAALYKTKVVLTRR